MPHIMATHTSCHEEEEAEETEEEEKEEEQQHADIKSNNPLKALHSSYILLRRQHEAFLLYASATFSAIKMASQMSSMILSLGGRWLKHLLSKEWLGLQLHQFCTNFAKLQAFQSTINLRIVMSSAQQITKLRY